MAVIGRNVTDLRRFQNVQKVQRVKFSDVNIVKMGKFSGVFKVM